MLESKIQKQIMLYAKKIGALAYKVNSESSRGFPDLVVILSTGVVLFVELKTATGVASALQLYTIKKLQDKKANAKIIRSEKEFIDYVSRFST